MLLRTVLVLALGCRCLLAVNQEEWHEAARAGNAWRLQSLLAQGAPIDDRGEHGATALHEAAQRGKAEAVRMLLQAGADDRLRDDDGRTALQVTDQVQTAASRDRVVYLLLTKAARPGPAALEYAAQRGLDRVAANLLDAGASVNAPNAQGDTPLHHAALKGRLTMAELLLNRGALVNARNAQGLMPLHDAALAGQRDVAELLLRRGAEIETRDTELGATPLYYAASWGRTSVVALLLDHGAAVNGKNRHGKTILQAAREAAEPAALALLQQHGARP